MIRFTAAKDLLPHAMILPALTDDALADPNGFYRNEARLALLRLPAKWRQTALAEHYARTMDVSWVNGNAFESYVNPSIKLDDVVSEILAFIQA